MSFSPGGQMKKVLQKFGLPALTLLTFFFLLGNRPLNEPDEGRYSEVAREMIETGDWVVPHFWYLPHLDKPPMTYWLVAISMKIFGQNEWAARLPVALAGISGVWAAYLLGCAMGGRRVGIWSALILQSAALYFLMGRMLTTDIFLAQFTAWGIYFFWRSWLAKEGPKLTFFAWHLAGWIAVALGFMTKGPIAAAIAMVSLAALLIFRREKISGTLVAGLVAGFLFFISLASPWFLVVFTRVPDSAHYMILGQAAGHLLGTTIKNRTGFPGYFFGVLAAGLLPWTLLLGWLWRRAHWRSLGPHEKEGWLLLNAWAIFTFTLFSLSHAKLVPYILPIFPALAVLLAWRFFGDDHDGEAVPALAWRTGLPLAFLLPPLFPFAVFFLLHDPTPLWLKLQVPLALAVILTAFVIAKKWKRQTVAAFSVALSLLGFWAVVAEFPMFDLDFKSNQPLNQIGLALRENFQPGDGIVCMGNLPQGLPFYSGGVISAANRPYFYYMNVKQVPFEFPGNLERFGSLYLTNRSDISRLLHENRRFLIISPGDFISEFSNHHPDILLRRIAQSGQWMVCCKDAGNAPGRESRAAITRPIKLEEK